MSLTFVVLDDGSEKICPHPCERTIAEEATGKSWSALAQANRLVYRYALVCLACGKLDYYGSRDFSANAQGGRAHLEHCASAQQIGSVCIFMQVMRSSASLSALWSNGLFVRIPSVVRILSRKGPVPKMPERFGAH